nr:MAG TPA: hypothetical protein [Caudoviricetes sp.]
MITKKYRAPSCRIHQEAAAAAGAPYGSPRANAAAVLDHFEDINNKIQNAQRKLDHLEKDNTVLSFMYSHLSADGLLDPLAPLPEVVEIKGRLSHVVAELLDLHSQYMALCGVYKESIRESAVDPGRSSPSAGDGREVVVNNQK